MRHLANAHSVTGPAGIMYRTSFSGICNCPLDRVLTYKILIYLLNLQFFFYETFESPVLPNTLFYLLLAVKFY